MSEGHVFTALGQASGLVRCSAWHKLVVWESIIPPDMYVAT